MVTVRFRHLGIAALVLSPLPLSALAQGLPTGKRPLPAPAPVTSEK